MLNKAEEGLDWDSRNRVVRVIKKRSREKGVDRITEEKGGSARIESSSCRRLKRDCGAAQPLR